MKSMTGLVALAVLVVGAHSAAAEGDVAAGEKVFNRCHACHTIEEGAGPKQGPNLFGVYGRTAGTAPPGTLHSDALAESGIVWDETTLTEWLKGPRKFVKGAKMIFQLSNDQDIADVIAYLKANSPEAQ